MEYLFAVDLGGTAVKYGCFTREGELLSQWECATGAEEILPRIAGELKAYMTRHSLPREKLLGVGIGVPGPVTEDGSVLTCVNLRWGETDVKGELSQLLELPVWVGNDATLAALGEMYYGGGAGLTNGALVTLGTGVGGGVILNGKGISGAHGAAGEIGHMVLCPEEEALCACGKRGCAEQYCSATGIVREMKKCLALSREKSLLREVDQFDCEDIFRAAAAGDALANRVLAQAYDRLGILLANLCCVIDPEVILLGGGVSKAGEPLLEGVRKAFEKHAFSACRHTRLALATLGNDAGIYGACRLVLEKAK